MRAVMALSKAVGCLVVLLVICYSLGYTEFLNGLIEEVMGTKASHAHVREKRVASLSSTSYELQAVINISDLAHLQALLRGLSFPLPINGTYVITSIDTTTVCSSNTTGYQCRCEESYAWSFNSCIDHKACDAIVGDTCGCINGLPTDGQYCQLNTSQTETTPPPPSPTLRKDFDIVVDMRFPVSRVPSNLINLLRDGLRNLQLPLNITQSLKVTGLDFTTGCFPNSTGGLQCECEEQFAWSCDKCVIYGACSNATSQTCGCINGLPSDGEFCRPITNVTQCPTPTPETTTISLTPVTTSTTSMTTISSMTTPITTSTTPMTTPVTTLTSSMTTPITTSTTSMITPVTTLTSSMTTPVTTLTSSMTTPVTTLTSSMTTPITTPTTSMTTSMTTPATPVTTPTSSMTTTTTTPVTGITAPTAPTEAMSLSFTMDMTFDSSYNDPSSSIYQNSLNSIEKQSRASISNFERIDFISFRSGSTICDYTVIATSFQDTEIRNSKVEIFKELVELYPMIFDSPQILMFDPPQVQFGGTVSVKCGPPPASLNFGTEWTAEWTRDNELIHADEHHQFSDQGATLTVSQFFNTDNGQYECMLRRINKSAFRQRASGQFTLQNRPVIQVSTVKKTVHCENGKEVQLMCSVNSPYEVEFKGTSIAGTGEITYQFPMNCEKQEEIFTCQVKNNRAISKDMTVVLSRENSFICQDPVFGVGNVGDQVVAPCEANTVGEKILVCEGDGNWREQSDNCILKVVQELLDQSQFLNNNSLPTFLKQLSTISLNSTEKLVGSPAGINAVVEIFSNIANLTIPITQTSMTDILITVGVLTTDAAKKSWETLNNSTATQNTSSLFLLSIETITKALTDDSFDIDIPLVILNKTTFADTFKAEFNSSVEANILASDGGNKSITVITFASMDNILPARDQDNSSNNVINGRVVLVQSNGTINNVSFTFDKINNTLGNPQCVFWNFTLFNGLGGWDDEGCELVRNSIETVICNCNHLTSFSILMSPFTYDDHVLDIITYIGVSISMASLVICLIIEAFIWKKIRRNNTSYLRHVSIVNIAVSLLIANIWFIIGAAISDSKDQPACTVTTFFVHFFYLALFFWMLASGLLLFYRTVSVFGGGLSKKSMLAIGFCLGYGIPIIIVTITIAVTAPRDEYIRQSGCWLNWDESKALLAFVVPALLIVLINLVILVVVIYKMLRRRATGDTAQAHERHVLVVIARSLAVLTPFFGLTWGLGVGTLTDPRNKAIHISFAFFNSLQGFFILVFGTLLDKRVLSEISVMSNSSRSGTGSTGLSSSGLGFFIRNWRRGRDGYNVSSGASSHSGGSHSFTNT